MIRRDFLVASAGLAAAACAVPAPCGSFDPGHWLDTSDAEGAARPLIDRAVRDHVGVEGSPADIKRFRQALDRFTLRPRVMANIVGPDTSVVVLGRTLPTPILVWDTLALPDSGRLLRLAVRGATAAGAGRVRDSAAAGPDIDQEAGDCVVVPWNQLPATASPQPTRVVAGRVRRADDARFAVDRGARALLITPTLDAREDGATPLEIVSSVRDAVPAHVNVLVQGAFRHGNEILIAVGLGADAIVTGWPVLWGAAAGGEPGALRVIQMLTSQLALAMSMCGCASLADARPDLVRTHRA